MMNKARMGVHLYLIAGVTLHSLC